MKFSTDKFKWVCPVISDMDFKQTARDNAEQRNNRQTEFSRIELNGDEPYVKAVPTTIVTGVFPEGEGNPLHRTITEDVENFPQDTTGRTDEAYIRLVLDDPDVVAEESQGTEDTIILETEDDATDYRVFNGADPNTEVVDGVGIKYNQNGTSLYEGEVVDSFPEGTRIQLVVSGNGHVSVAKKLDVAGNRAASMSPVGPSVTNGGLIEYVPDELREQFEFSQRYARTPEVRDELLGNRVGIMTARASDMLDNYSGRDSYWLSVFDIDGDRELEEEFTRMPSSGNYSFLLDDWNQYDPSVADQKQEIQEFADAYAQSGNDTDAETIRESVNSQQERFDHPVNVDAIVEAVQNR